MRRHAVPICFNVIGLGWAGPLINDIGSEEEKAKYLKGILTAEDIWCQGFSEPDHGSDLGNAQTRAVRDGDEYVLNGQKIWTTMGNFAKYMILLARTNPETARKYDGLSYFLSPMHVPGIETRPIRKITGEYRLYRNLLHRCAYPRRLPDGRGGAGLEDCHANPAVRARCRSGGRRWTGHGARDRRRYDQSSSPT